MSEITRAQVLDEHAADMIPALFVTVGRLRAARMHAGKTVLEAAQILTDGPYDMGALFVLQVEAAIDAPLPGMIRLWADAYRVDPDWLAGRGKSPGWDLIRRAWREVTLLALIHVGRTHPLPLVIDELHAYTHCLGGLIGPLADPVTERDLNHELGPFGLAVTPVPYGIRIETVDQFAIRELAERREARRIRLRYLDLPGWLDYLNHELLHGVWADTDRQAILHPVDPTGEVVVASFRTEPDGRITAVFQGPQHGSVPWTFVGSLVEVDERWWTWYGQDCSTDKEAS